MSGRYLLDTNIVIALLADEAATKNNLAKADEVFVSSIALGELCFGAWKSGRPRANLDRIDEFAANSVVLGCDADTARRYGEVKNILRLKGRPLEYHLDCSIAFRPNRAGIAGPNRRYINACDRPPHVKRDRNRRVPERVEVFQPESAEEETAP